MVCVVSSHLAFLLSLAPFAPHQSSPIKEEEGFPKTHKEKMSFNLSRLTHRDLQYLPGQTMANPNTEGLVVSNYNSFNYDHIQAHIHVQRANHQMASYAYRANQVIKHAYQDGYVNRQTLDYHTNQMDMMSDRDAHRYARQYLHDPFQ